jgi:hypothetical protein
MATRNPAVTASGDGSVKRFAWAGAQVLALNDIGAPIPFSEWADRSVQFLGTFGAAGTVVWEGSNKDSPTLGTGADWFTLTDPQGNAISKTAASGEAVLEVTQWARPRCTGGDGTTAIEVYVTCRRQHGMRA